MVNLLKKRNILLIVTLTLLGCLIIYGSKENMMKSNLTADESISIVYSQGKNKEQIKGFYSEEILYFCLPEYMELQDVTLKDKEFRQLQIGSMVFENGDPIVGIENNRLYNASYGRKGEEGESLQIMFMQGSRLPVVRISTASGSLSYIHSQKGNSESGFMQIYDADGKLMSITDIKSIAGRGNTAWDAIKKSYTIHLDDAVNILGMGAEKEWVLNANYYDGAYIRNQIGFEIAQTGGIAYVSDTHFVELYINDDYMGLYQIIGKIKTGKNRIDISDGYLLEIDYGFRVFEEDDYIMLLNEQPIVIQSSPKKCDVESVQQFFDDFSYKIEQGIVPLDQINLESFAKMFVMEDILQDMDFGYSSHYMTLDLKKGVLSDGPIWDLDNTMGRGIVTQAEPLFVTKYDLNYNNLSRWYARLYANESFRAQVVKEYRENFRPILLELTDGGVEKHIEAIENSVQMDLKRFPGTRSVFMSDASFEENVEYLLAYLKTKLKIMDDYFLIEADNTIKETQLPLLEKQEFDFEEEADKSQEEETGGIISIFMQYKMLFMLLVISILCMVLYYRCRKTGK